MATNESIRTSAEKAGRPGFRIANGPVIRHEQGGENGIVLDSIDLPRVYGAPLLFAIPRDPHTLFTYWNIDWSSVVAQAEPVDRQIYLRVKRGDGTEESESVIEPMLGSYYAPVTTPRGVYGVELGYYESSGAWRSVAVSDSVTMPPDSASESVDIDVATVPFHLSFQRLIDLFRGSNGGSITSVIGRLQGRALTEEERALLSPEELEILRAMSLSLAEMEEARRAFSGRISQDAVRKRAEAVLGFGSSSPAHPFGESGLSSSAFSSRA